MKRGTHKRLGLSITAIGSGAGMALQYIPDLQGMLPDRWYVGAFIALFVLHLIADARDE